MAELAYPFVYECSACDNETTVTRDHAGDFHPNPDSIEAVKTVLKRRGWMQLPIGRIYCPRCKPPGMND